MSAELNQVIRSFAGRRVLVLGDMVADEYLMGRPDRISREAPVLILHHAGSFIRPGGATNPAYNLRRLGADTRVIGVIGDDEMGRRLCSTLEEAGMDTDCLFVDTGRPTSTKTRIVARGSQEAQQQIVRIDRVDTSALSPMLRDQVIDAVRPLLAGIDALLVSDYENGVISPEMIDACLPRARQAGVRVVVDSHGDLFRFTGVTAATPNQPEAAASLHRRSASEEEVDQAGTDLLTGMDADGILITRGSEGIALYERGRAPYKLPIATESELLVDPTGAGDTVAAVFTLALSCGAGMRQATYLGNVAAGEVVRQLGAATLTAADLTRAVETSRLPAPLGIAVERT
ncbi:MAG: bifunctional heptose 7-phosphate kinase/heptose 1-phosphate adenyltransferase [Chloroflexota bacterium]